MSTIQKIKDAVMTLTPKHREELYEWLDQHYGSLFDVRIKADVAASRLDGVISRALDNKRNGILKPL